YAGNDCGAREDGSAAFPSGPRPLLRIPPAPVAGADAPDGLRTGRRALRNHDARRVFPGGRVRAYGRYRGHDDAQRGMDPVVEGGIREPTQEVGQEVWALKSAS